MKAILTATTLAAALFGSVAAQADDWKDESGKGRGRGGITVQVPYSGVPYDRGYDRGQRGGYDQGYYHVPRVPDGHLPPPGECRVWYPDRPAGHQPPPFKC
jgi:hypothetical protein